MNTVFARSRQLPSARRHGSASAARRAGASLSPWRPSAVRPLRLPPWSGPINRRPCRRSGRSRTCSRPPGSGLGSNRFGYETRPSGVKMLAMAGPPCWRFRGIAGCRAGRRSRSCGSAGRWSVSGASVLPELSATTRSAISRLRLRPRIFSTWAGVRSARVEDVVRARARAPRAAPRLRPRRASGASRAFWTNFQPGISKPRSIMLCACARSDLIQCSIRPAGIEQPADFVWLEIARAPAAASGARLR